MVVEMEGDGGGLYEHLHKLSSIKKSSSSSSEDETENERERIVIEEILLSLWNTRKTGLSSLQKSRFQSLLHLPSVSLLDPVFASLRSLMRKYVNENMNGDDLLKLFPPNLPIHLQSILLSLFHKHKPHWSLPLLDHHLLTTTTVHPPVLIPPPPLPFLHNHNHNASSNIFGPPGPSSSSAPLISHSILSLHRERAAATTTTVVLPLDDHDHDYNNDDDHQGMLPRLKSMTWSMEKSKSGPAHKVAVITLKLQDYTNSTSGEMEVKFRLTRDTLEAMLRSMTYISEQLSTIVGSSSGPVQKKQRQSDHIV